jgi:alkylhydroperoxidase family enzyme
MAGGSSGQLDPADGVASRGAPSVAREPRIPPLQVDELSADLLAIVSRMIRVNAALGSRQKEMLTDLVADSGSGAAPSDLSTQVADLPEIVRTMLRHPHLFASQVDVGIELLAHGALTPRDRELAILRVSWLCRAAYSWGEHVHVAKSIGIGSDEIERVTQGSQAPGWNEHERAVIEAAEELHRDAVISDSTWAVLSKRLDERQLIELPIVIGQYQTIAYYQNSLRLRLHEGNQGLAAR